MLPHLCWGVQPGFMVAMNEILKVMGMKISGGASFTQWTVSDGRSMVRYEDGMVSWAV